MPFRITKVNLDSFDGAQLYSDCNKSTNLLQLWLVENTFEISIVCLCNGLKLLNLI